MYKRAQTEFKLDAVITEFCDIYSPIAQILKEQDGEYLRGGLFW